VYLAAVGDFLDALRDAVEVSGKDSGPAAVDSHVVVGFLVHSCSADADIGFHTALPFCVHNNVTGLQSSSVELIPTAECGPRRNEWCIRSHRPPDPACTNSCVQ